MRRHAKGEVSKAKQKLWQLCRRLVKIKHKKSDGTFQCYTCPQVLLEGQNQFHTGHFISSSICSTAMRYDLENLRPQCATCNVWKGGNWVEFETHLRKDGVDVEALKQRNRDTRGKKFDILWYKAKISEYENLLESL